MSEGRQEQVVYIERTRKSLKAMKFIGICFFLGGVLIYASPSGFEKFLGATFMIGGLSSYIIGKILTWWHHG